MRVHCGHDGVDVVAGDMGTTWFGCEAHHQVDILLLMSVSVVYELSWNQCSVRRTSTLRFVSKGNCLMQKQTDM